MSEANLRQQLEEQQKMIDILMKVAPKALLSRHLPKGENGMKVKIPFYKNDDGTLSRVKSLKMHKDDVYISKEGEVANQVMRLTIEQSPNSRRIQGLRMAMGKATDEEKKQEIQDKIEAEQNGGGIVDIDLSEFSKSIERVIVDLDTEKTIYNKEGLPTEFFFTYDGKECSIDPKIVNI